MKQFKLNISKGYSFHVKLKYIKTVNIKCTHQTGDGDGWPVGPAHEEPFQDNLVEGSIRATCQEPVQLQRASEMLD